MPSIATSERGGTKTNEANASIRKATTTPAPPPQNISHSQSDHDSGGCDVRFALFGLTLLEHGRLGPLGLAVMASGVERHLQDLREVQSRTVGLL